MSHDYVSVGLCSAAVFFRSKYPGAGINVTGLEVTIADVVEGEEVDRN